MTDAYMLTPRECTELQRKAYDDGYEQGQRDALAAAVQRVEALLSREPWQQVEPVIAAIKGDSDEA